LKRYKKRSIFLAFPVYWKILNPVSTVYRWQAESKEKIIVLSADGINRRIDVAEGKISEFEFEDKMKHSKRRKFKN